MTTISSVTVWVMFGMLLVVFQYGIWRFLRSKGRNTLPLEICGFIANFLVIFTLGWAYASMIEHEYQAVGMGFIFFGGAALIPIIITYRLATQKKSVPQDKMTENTSAMK